MSVAGAVCSNPARTDLGGGRRVNRRRYRDRSAAGRQTLQALYLSRSLRRLGCLRATPECRGEAHDLVRGPKQGNRSMKMSKGGLAYGAWRIMAESEASRKTSKTSAPRSSLRRWMRRNGGQVDPVQQESGFCVRPIRAGGRTPYKIGPACCSRWTAGGESRASAVAGSQGAGLESALIRDATGAGAGGRGRRNSQNARSERGDFGVA